jgi:hypothetical protein
MAHRFPSLSLLALAALLSGCSGSLPSHTPLTDGADSVDDLAPGLETGTALEDGARDGGSSDGVALEGGGAKLKDGGSSADANPLIGLLETTVVSQIVEPPGSGKDDIGASYTDKNYWNFCAPGAVTAALYYLKPTNVTGWAAGYFREPQNAPSTIPSKGTYWKSDENASGYHTYGRAYMLYLAMQMKPPGYSVAGMVPYTTYPTTGATAVRVRDALNWEASGHSTSTWSTFLYKVVSYSGLTATKLHTDIVAAIRAGRAVLVSVDTAYLPNWSRSLAHEIAVIGFNDVSKTYSFVDTCGVKCNGSTKSKNGGIWSIAQSSLLTAIKAAQIGYVH